MKVIILVDYSSSEFNKDFDLGNALISQGHTILLVNTIEQLERSFNSYEILLIGNSNTYESLEFDQIKKISIKDKSLTEIMEYLK